ncbi:MAG: hypothetical protein Q9165_001439 [Trypethelium subeluteriae]
MALIGNNPQEFKLPWSPPPPPPTAQDLDSVDTETQEENADNATRISLDPLENSLQSLAWPCRFAKIRATLLEFKVDDKLNPEASRKGFEYLVRQFEQSSPENKEKRKQLFSQAIMPFMLDRSVNLPEARNLDLLFDVLGKKQLSNTIYSGLLGMLTNFVRMGTTGLASASTVCGQVERLREKVGQTSGIKKRHVNQKLAHLHKIYWRAMAQYASSKSDPLDNQIFRNFYDHVAHSRFLIVSAPKLRERLMAEASQYAFPKPSSVQPDKIEEYLKTWTERLESAAAVVTPNGKYSSATGQAIYVLNSLAHEEAHNKILDTTKEILTTKPLSSPERSCWTAALRIWASCVVRSAPFVCATDDDARCREIVELLAPFVKPVSLALYLDRLDAYEGAKLLMQTWVKRRILDPTLRKSNFPIEPVNLHEYHGRLGIEGHSSKINELLTVRKPRPHHELALDATLRGHQATLPTDSEALGEQYFHLISTKFSDYTSRHPPNLPSTSIAPYMDLIAAVAHTGLSYRRLMTELFHLIPRFSRPTTPTAGLHHIHQAHGIRALKRLAVQLITHCTAHDPIEALHLFRLIRAVHPRSVPPDFFVRIAEEGLAQTALLWRLVVPENSPAAFTPARVELLHRVAEAVARSPHVRHLVAARFVQRLWEEMRGVEGVQVDARVSRALVRAAVIRPLKEGDWVATARFRKVLEVVAEVEGGEEAEKLDRLVWKWRGKALWERRYEYEGVDDVEAFRSRRDEVEEGFRWRKYAREREVIRESGRGGDGDLDPHRFWKSVPEGETVKEMRFYYMW